MTARELRFPTRVMLEDGNIRGAANLLNEKPLQSPSYATVPCTELNGPCSIVLDFGVEMRAGVRINAHHVILKNRSEVVTVRIRMGESVTETCAELSQESGPTNDHAPRDFTVPVSSMSDILWGQSGFRFVRLDFNIPSDGYVRLFSVVAVGEILSLPVQYTYSGNDPVMADIYTAAKRTIDLCAAGDYVWDGIKRDRLVWIGDMHPEMLALTTLYGRVPSMENSLVFLKDTTPKDKWMCSIMTYSAWWIITLADYYDITGCADFVAPLLPYAAETLKRLLSMVDKEGNMVDDGSQMRIFVDWPTHGQADELTGARCILLMMAKKAASLFSAMAMPAGDAIELMNRLLKTPMDVKESMQVVGLKYMATGELSKNEVALLGKKGAAGMSTFMSYYILTAYARYFGKEAALSVMKEYYSPMLSRGATTFWEDFDLSWLEGSSRIDEFPAEGEKDLHGDYGKFCYKGFRHSFCHAWSTGILRFMKDCGV